MRLEAARLLARWNTPKVYRRASARLKDEGLRTRLKGLAAQRRRFGYGFWACCCPVGGNRKKLCWLDYSTNPPYTSQNGLTPAKFAPSNWEPNTEPALLISED